MSEINVSPEEVEATMPAWVKADPILQRLFHGSLTWRVEMLRADKSIDRQSDIERVTRLAHEHDLARATITLAEAERRWKKTNLRQNPPNLPFRWKSEDGRGTWLTTTYAMEAAFGPEPKE